mmetsp:Transcript_96734/g.312358  ORF Transcript_96734/g.312358 Transcript_96734/m.312358 type:complete len:320 (+) Transcript_96734:2463-3422(+)
MPPSFSLARARRMCAGSITSEFSCFASSMPLARKRLAAGVNGISLERTPFPRPSTSSTVRRASFTVTPNFFITFAEMPVFSAMTPTKSISVLTKLCPRRRDSSCAVITALIAFSLNCSNIMVIEDSLDVGLSGVLAVTAPAIEEPRKVEVLDETHIEPAVAKEPLGAPSSAPASAARAGLLALPLRGTPMVKVCANRTASVAAAAAIMALAAAATLSLASLAGATSCTALLPRASGSPGPWLASFGGKHRAPRAAMPTAKELCGHKQPNKATVPRTAAKQDLCCRRYESHLAGQAGTLLFTARAMTRQRPCGATIVGIT